MKVGNYIITSLHDEDEEEITESLKKLNLRMKDFDNFQETTLPKSKLGECQKDAFLNFNKDVIKSKKEQEDF